MASCLSNYNSAGVPAIGYLSTDFRPGATGEFDGFRWVKVDGITPSAIAVADGKWRMWSELSVNYNTAGAYGVTGDTASFYNALKTTSSNNALLADIVSGLTQVTGGQFTGAVLGARSGNKNPTLWGIPPAAGVLSATRTAATMLSTPTNPHTHQNTSAFNLCAPARTAPTWQPR
jgi:hypothetical protein